MIAVVVAAGLQGGATYVLVPHGDLKPDPRPEICDNGIDDDLDGLIDRADEVDCHDEVAVEVKPVLDLEGLTLKQGQKMPVLPDMWGAPKPPAPAPAVDKTFASTKTDPDKTPKDDDKKKEMADAGVEPNPTDAGETKDDSDAGGAQTDPSDAGTENELDAGTGTIGDPNGVPDGDTEDPLKANAKKTYYARVYSFLKGMWNSHCTDENATASGTITLSGRTITGVSGTGLEFLQGATIPAPPDNYPDLYFQPSPVNFTCPKKTPAP
ncbi:MAG: hypothetical protein U0414_01055 [Polyangiaceae bacterium]